MWNPLTRLKKMATGDWRYQGITNRHMNKHNWTNGPNTLSVFYQNGAADHVGYVVEVERAGHDATLMLSNGFIETFGKALIIADLHMRDDDRVPAVFMQSDRVESDKGPGTCVRQDEWLEAHAHDYEFGVIDPNQLE